MVFIDFDVGGGQAGCDGAIFMQEPVITDNLVLAIKIAIRGRIETNAGRARLRFALGIVKLVMSELASGRVPQQESSSALGTF